jgi:hypothetical protein
VILLGFLAILNLHPVTALVFAFSRFRLDVFLPRRPYGGSGYCTNSIKVDRGSTINDGWAMVDAR